VGAARMRRDWSVTVGQGARRDCQRAGGTVPCTIMCGSGPARVRVHRNARCGLGALGGTIASEWHGHCTAQGGSKVAASRGIGRGCVGEVDGEVTGLEVVGAGPAHVGSGLGLCSVGSRETVGMGWRKPIGGWPWWWRRRE
jgi:hypothetical protein